MVLTGGDDGTGAECVLAYVHESSIVAILDRRFDPQNARLEKAGEQPGSPSTGLLPQREPSSMQPSNMVTSEQSCFRFDPAVYAKPPGGKVAFGKPGASVPLAPFTVLDFEVSVSTGWAG
jgi:hypothetical protein